MDGGEFKIRVVNDKGQVVYDPQTAKGDAARLSVIDVASAAGIARDIVLRTRVTDSQLAAATAATNETGEQSIAMLGRTMVPACGDVVAHHLADRLRPLQST